MGVLVPVVADILDKGNKARSGKQQAVYTYNLYWSERSACEQRSKLR